MSAYWTWRGDKIAYCFAYYPENAPVFLADSRTRKIVAKSDDIFNPIRPYVSRSGHYYGGICGISNPAQGDEVFRTDRRIGGPICLNTDAFTPSEYLPGVIEDWTLNDKWILWDWRIASTDDGGNWIQEDLGLTSLNGRVRLLVAHWAKLARFSDDTKYIFYIGYQASNLNKGNLTFVTRHSLHKTVLANNVTSYIVK